MEAWGAGPQGLRSYPDLLENHYQIVKTVTQRTQTAMKRNSARRHPKVAGAAPSMEAVQIHVLQSIAHWPVGLTVDVLPPQMKKRYRQFDKHPERLEDSKYEAAAHQLAKLLSWPKQVLDDRNCELIKEELRCFLSRYENLLLQLKPGHATTKQILWSLCVRFFVPWTALRCAFLLRNDAPDQIDTWFLPPVSGRKVGCVFMGLIDRHCRRSGESRDGMARRLYESLRADVSTKEQRSQNLGEDFSRYRRGEMLASDGRINFLVVHSGCGAHIRFKLVLARAIDSNLRQASNEFGVERAIELAKEFSLVFRHCHGLLYGLRAELPKDNAAAWQWLDSPTFTGNTPFDAERIHPLIDEFMGKLAQRISAELQQLRRGSALTHAPTTRAETRRGRFDVPHDCFLPDEIHEAIRHSNYPSALSASQALFSTKRGAPGEAARVGRFLIRAVNDASDRSGEAHPLDPPANERPDVMAEGVRLLQLARSKSGGRTRSHYDACLFRLLLDPRRPKTQLEHALARKLAPKVMRFYRETGLPGSADFLIGLLCWLEGQVEESMRHFEAAAQGGRSSCGEDWITLLRLAPILAESTSRRTRRLNHFRKLSKIEGVLHGEASAKTNLLLREIRQREGVSSFNMSFRPFPG